MRQTTRLLFLGLVIIALAHILDPWAYEHLRKQGVYDKDFGRMLRVIGYLPLWLLMGLALWLETRDRRRALLLALVPGLGGLMAEVLKLLFRRERPGPHDGEYYFRSFLDQPWSTKALGLPSSHAMVAFSGAWVLCRLYPKASPVWVALALGCGITRVQAGAHFLSDVAVAAIAAYVVVEFSWRRWGPRPA
ncbi:MAG TPA: phosphatase PAP2 family protein [Gemmatimonadales bacterium]|nr:phosphatase PAP2 family protein [Gemmatimonadales bacterium]